MSEHDKRAKQAEHAIKEATFIMTNLLWEAIRICRQADASPSHRANLLAAIARSKSALARVEEP